MEESNCRLDKVDQEESPISLRISKGAFNKSSLSLRRLYKKLQEKVRKARERYNEKIKR